MGYYIKYVIVEIFIHKYMHVQLRINQVQGSRKDVVAYLKKV
jgi:hypothetical protein